jgi:hypothetical protein
MIEAKYLFHGYDIEGSHNNRHHMHEVVSLLGEPPSRFRECSPHTWRLFDENGRTSINLAYLTQGTLLIDHFYASGRPNHNWKSNLLNLGCKI